ncbi:MAG TPA: hypothetical protein VLL08_25305 [Kineosporiaceae bacterium]|nr:hypothetical protein [Kineosporiaceae bacterium]
MAQRLLVGAQAGTVIEFGPHDLGGQDYDALDRDAIWGPDRQISAAALLDLLTGRTAVRTHSRGVRIRGARLVGEVEWDWQRLPVPLELLDCIIDNPINLDHAEVAGLSLIRCRLPGLSAEQMSCASTLKLVGSAISGTVILRDAVISGALLANGAGIQGQMDDVDRVGVRVALLGTRMQVTGALIIGDGFTAEGSVLLPGARIGGNLNCSGGRFANPGQDVLTASGADISANVFLDEGFAAQGRVLFDRARIGGDLVCDDGTFDGRQTKAFSGNRMDVGGGLFMRAGFTATGAVRLFGAQIGGSWDCTGGTFVNPAGEESIWASGARIQGSVYFHDGFSSVGSIRLRGVQIGGNLSCPGGRFANPGRAALRAVNLTVDGDLLLGSVLVDNWGLVAEGEVNFVGAKIGGLVQCRGATFRNPGKPALSFADSEISGNVDLSDGFHAVGEVLLAGARLGGHLGCRGGTFVNPAMPENPDAIALNLVGIEVDDSVLLHHGFRAEGQVRLNRARIGGLLDCSASTFHNPGGFSLFARALRVGAGVLLGAGFIAEGSVRLNTAQITGDLNCSGGAFNAEFLAAGSTVSGSFRWRQIAVPPTGNLDLRRTSVGELDDDLASWPTGGRLWLAGFSYGRLSDRAPRSPADRVEWIRRQTGYHPEPYQQIAAVYRSNGQIDEATTVAIAQQDDLLARGDLTGPAKAWAWFLGRSLGHGYRPGRAVWALLVLYLVTVGTVWLGARADSFIQVGDTAPQPTVTASRCADAYPCLSVPAYALENITPILNLHQGENWQPKSSTTTEWILRDWLYLSTVVGYAGTTLLAAGLTGLARSA